jgi:DNA-binding LacI/PurR family transcriptional regulator
MATIADIAKQAGVSEMTVSNVLRGKIKGVRSDAVRRAKRIRKIADDLGYRPNTAARQMRAQKFGAAAMVSRRNIGLFHFNVVKGLMRGLAAHDMHLIQAELDRPGEDKELATPRLMRELCVDGILVDDASDIPAELIEQVEALDMPAVWINTAGDHDCVDPDDEDAALRLAQAVIQAGHRNIAYVGLGHENGMGHYSGRARLRGSQQAASQAGLSLTALPSDAISTIDAGCRLIDEHPDITAWIFFNEHDCRRMAFAAERTGLSMPADLSVATFANTQTSVDDPFQPTHVMNPMIEVGITAADMIVEKIDSPGKRLPVVLVPWEGPYGETLGPPRT